MNRLSDWLRSCSFEEVAYQSADEACEKWIAPFFHQTVDASLEEFITSTIKLYKEVEYIRDHLLGDQLKVNFVSRKEFAENVMFAWIDRYPHRASIIRAVCYDLNV